MPIDRRLQWPCLEYSPRVTQLRGLPTALGIQGQEISVSHKGPPLPRPARVPYQRGPLSQGLQVHHSLATRLPTPEATALFQHSLRSLNVEKQEGLLFGRKVRDHPERHSLLSLRSLLLAAKNSHPGDRQTCPASGQPS